MHFAGVLPEKVSRVYGPLPKTLTLFMSKICDSPYTIYIILPKVRYPIYGRCCWHSYAKQNLLRALVDGLIDNDGKKAFS